jgi:hypothetical protein
MNVIKTPNQIQVELDNNQIIKFFIAYAQSNLITKRKIVR